jgi:hypothetical protein
MKVGISYNLFDGEELLEASIKSVRDNVDYISIVYQTESNFGNPCSPDLIPLLEELKNKKLIDELYRYKPKTNQRGHYNEITKRNIGLSLSQGRGCTHHMAIDSDEFYTDSQFKYLKEVMDKEDYDACACQMVTYYKEPTYILDPKESYYVSLLYKIKSGCQYIMNHDFPVLVDPTRRMKSAKCKIFTRKEIEMHHMSYVRKDISIKFQNSSAVSDGYTDSFNLMKEHYDSWELGKKAVCGIPLRPFNVIKTENIFNVKW